MQLLTTVTLLATAATAALACPGPVVKSEEVAVTKFYAKHIPHSENSTVSFDIMHLSGVDVGNPSGQPAATIKCYYDTINPESSNGLATFGPKPCATNKYSFAFEKDAQQDFFLELYDRAGMVGRKTFGKGMFYTTEGDFHWQYIASVGHFDVELKKPGT